MDHAPALLFGIHNRFGLQQEVHLPYLIQSHSNNCSGNLSSIRTPLNTCETAPKQEKKKSHVMNKKADANLWCPGKQHGGRLAWSECEQPRDESCWQQSMNRTNTAHQRTSQFADIDEAHLHPAPYKTTGSVCVPGTRWGFAGFMAISPPQHKLQVRSFKLIVKVTWGLILERNSPTLQVRPASMNNPRLKIKEWNGKN